MTRVIALISKPTVWQQRDVTSADVIVARNVNDYVRGKFEM